MTTTTRGPLDLRLWRRSAAARRYIVATVALTTVSAIAIVAGAVCIGLVLGRVITDGSGNWFALAGLVIAVVVDAACTWLRERFGHRAADDIVTDIEMEVLTNVTARPVRRDSDITHDAFVLVTRSLTDLRIYLAEYVPALGTALTVPPIVLAVIAWFDLTSALIVVATVPFVPCFHDPHRSAEQGPRGRDAQPAHAAVCRNARRSRRTADAAGARPRTQLDGRLRQTGDRYRHTALGALRIAFLSSLVLEFIATSERRACRREHRPPSGVRRDAADRGDHRADPGAARLRADPYGRGKVPCGRGRSGRAAAGGQFSRRGPVSHGDRRHAAAVPPLF